MAVLVTTGASLLALAGLGGFAPSRGSVTIASSDWTLDWGFAPIGPPGPLWYPNGTCAGFSGTVPAAGEFSCYVDLSGGEHCVPLNGTSAACSDLVGMIVDPPFDLVSTHGTFCISGCAGVYATIMVPQTPGLFTLHGIFVFQGYYHT